MRFPGTEQEIDANRATHSFTWTGEDQRCLGCDCRPWGVSAEWPCGAEVPRVDRVFIDRKDGAGWMKATPPTVIDVLAAGTVCHNELAVAA